MTETFQQYTARLLNYSAGKNALEIQKTTPKKLKRLLKGLKKNQIMARRNGKWSIAEILAHLSEGEMVTGYRLRTIISSSGTPIQAYDQDSWVGNSFYLKKHPEEALELFEVLRKHNLALLQSLPKKLWNSYGMHAERGKESIEKIVKLVAGHDLNHLKGITETIRKIRKDK
jgi:DinB superfamily